MPQIQNGQGLDIAVPPGQSIAISSISGTYSASLLYGTKDTLATNSDGGATFGPYASGNTVRLTAGSSSVIAYDVGSSPSAQSALVPTYATDSAGNVTGLVGPDGYTRQLVASKIKAAIAAARNNNAQVLPPICAAPTWAVGVAYGAGQIVRGTGADAVNLYFMAGSGSSFGVEGTSAASGTGPSGTANSLITDGTCRWVFIGKATATDAVTPLESTATLSSSSSEMNGYLQVINTTTSTAIGLTGYRPSTGGTFATEAYFTGGLYGARNTERVNGHNSGTAVSPVYNSSTERGSFSLCTNSRKWIGIFAQSSTIGKNVAYEFLINGRRLSESSYVRGVDSASGERMFLLNLSKFPDGVKQIEVRVNDNIQSRIAFELYLEAGAFVWPSENPNRFRMAFEGDSITMGSYFAGSKPAYWLERIVGDRLGCDAVYSNAEGGTGFISDASGTKTTYLNRLSDIVNFQPDILFIGGGHNDTASTSLQRQAAVLAYLQAVRSQLPNVYIVVIGTQLLQGESNTSGSQYTIEQDVKAAVLSFSDPNTLFIPLLTDVRPRLSSANGPHYLVTSAPYSDSHPTPGYYPFIGGLVAEKIAAWMATR